MSQRNVIFVFADQWRAQATGYAGDPNVRTPNLDRLAAESVNAVNAVSGCPVCTPYRASLLTGQYPLTHGAFVNDVHLGEGAVSLAQAFARGGYDTAYIGKWHVDGRGRRSYIPPERRQGFDYWKVLECTHDYNASPYYAGDSDEPLVWDGYDAVAQTRDAQAYIRGRGRGGEGEKPFLLVLSWGPPHAPLHSAPERHRAMYDPAAIELPPNVPAAMTDEAKAWLAGYYAHCSALDDCVGELLETLTEEGLAAETLFVFTSDHGDMLGSHSLQKKQKPWAESVRVPLLFRCPALFSRTGRRAEAMIDAPDLLPTLCGLCDLPIPDTAEGLNFAAHLRGGADPSDGAALYGCYQPFGQWRRDMDGPPEAAGRECRGLLTARYTYIRDLNGPWLLYDNQRDPYQMTNLIDDPAHADRRAELDAWLQRRLDAAGDAFLPGSEYIRQWGYTVNKHGTVPYKG